MHKLIRATWLHFIVLFFALFTLSACADGQSEQKSVRAGINQAFQAWVKAIDTAKGDPTKVAALYAKDALLLPTFDNKILKTTEERNAYFKNFTAYKNITVSPKIFIVQDFGDTAIASGMYRFYYLNTHDKSEFVDARFTFVYENIDGKWMIVNHQSSILSNPKK